MFDHSKISNEPIEMAANKLIEGLLAWHQARSVIKLFIEKDDRFMDEEIQKHGNPKDKAGLTLLDWMERAG